MENLDLKEALKQLDEIRDQKIKFINSQMYYEAADCRDKERKLMSLIEKLEKENSNL